MVEIYHVQASYANPSTDKLKFISTKIKCASLGKISNRGRNEVDPTYDISEEDSIRQANGMLDDGQPAQGEASPIRRAKDQWHHPHQSEARSDADN